MLIAIAAISPLGRDHLEVPRSQYFLGMAVVCQNWLSLCQSYIYLSFFRHLRFFLSLFLSLGK